MMFYVVFWQLCGVSVCIFHSNVFRIYTTETEHHNNTKTQTALNQKPIYHNQANVVLSHCLCQTVIVMPRSCWETNFHYYTMWCNWMFIFRPNPKSKKKRKWILNPFTLLVVWFFFHVMTKIIYQEQRAAQKVKCIKISKKAWIKCWITNDKFFKIQGTYCYIFRLILNVCAGVRSQLAMTVHRR